VRLELIKVSVKPRCTVWGELNGHCHASLAHSQSQALSTCRRDGDDKF
jgi:hypothetical protein